MFVHLATAGEETEKKLACKNEIHPAEWQSIHTTAFLNRQRAT